MKPFYSAIIKSEVGSIIAILIIVGSFSIGIMSMLVHSVDKTISTLVIGQSFSLSGFVAGYYFNKKTNSKEDNEDSIK